MSEQNISKRPPELEKRLTGDALHYYKKTKKRWKKLIVGKPSRQVKFVSFTGTIWHVLKKALLIILIFGIFSLALTGGFGLGMISGYIETTKPLEITNVKKTYKPTVILDCHGKKLSTLSGSQDELREFAPISVLKPTYIDDAFIAIEDERFTSHHGIDNRRIASAIGSFFLSGGEPEHGASTITQQVVKMMSSNDEKSAERKVQEWERAMDLERNMSKDEIMELFLNMVPMANRCVGVQSAARHYFGKNAADLDLAECAFLAGIPNLPSIYNPRTEYGRRNALRRMRIVLGKMLELNKISYEEYEAALNRELIFVKENAGGGEFEVNSYFVDALVDQVISDLMEKRGYSYTMAWMTVFQYGITIEATVDPEVQKKAEANFAKESLFASDPEAINNLPEHPQGAISIINNDPAHLGEVVGLVGGFGQKKQNYIFNRATQARRQTGSSIKPVLVYAPALDLGLINAGMIFNDNVKHLDPNNPNEEWPVNFDYSHSGAISARDALMVSKNTIAVEIYSKILGASAGLSYLTRLGIDRMNELQPSGALGAFSEGMTTLEMAGAFSALANGGVFVKPFLYKRVLDGDGNVILENKPVPDQVFRPETATIATNMLQGNMDDYDWYQANSRLDNQPAAGKTGTTSDNIDVWFCGYTPYYTASVWYGYDNANGRRFEIPDDDNTSAMHIWRAVMNSLHEDKAVKEFAERGDVTKLLICRQTGDLATHYCKNTYYEIYDAHGNRPKNYCKAHAAPRQLPPPQPLPPEPTKAGRSH